MKKLLVILMALAFVAGFSAVSFAGIALSKHDFSAAAWNGTGEICKTCHTPHNADTSVLDSPLWNHTLSATASYTLYDSATFDASATITQPGGVSKLCLSCHDGTVALDAFGGNTVSPGTLIGAVGTGSGDLGTSLLNDHPVSFTYDATLVAADPELNDPTAAPIAGWLFSSKVECASCHDPHNTPGFAKLLRADNTGSALCLTCHNK